MSDDDELLASVPKTSYLVHNVYGVVPLTANEPTSGSSHSARADAAGEKKKRKKQKKKKLSLYDLYTKQQSSSDEGGDVSSEGDNLDEAATLLPYGGSSLSTIGAAPSSSSAAAAYDVLPYEIGMDINILINQVHQNVLRSICIDDYDGSARFLDDDLICLAAALRHNASVVSLQLRYLPVTDVSLVPLCKALEGHPAIRALDLSGTKGTRKTGEALRRLVCNNTHLLHVMIEETLYLEKDVAVIQEAVQYNAMVCPDPRLNPYDLKMISKISKLERDQRLLEEQLSYNPFIQGPPPSSMLHTQSETGRDCGELGGSLFDAPQASRRKHKKRAVTFREDERENILTQQVCAEYVRGCCKYGSRCKYYHPPWSPALEQVASLQRYKEEEERRAKWQSVTGSMSGSASVGPGSECGTSASRPPQSHDTRSQRWEDATVSAFQVSQTCTDAKRSRQRDANFTLDVRKVSTLSPAPVCALPSHAASENCESDVVADHETRTAHIRRMVLAVCCVCCCAMTVSTVLRRPMNRQES